MRFLKFLFKNKCCMVLKCLCLGLQNKYFLVQGVKLKIKALQHFEVDPVL